MSTVWAILRKECRSEWRTRYGVGAALLFALATLAGVSFAVGPLGDRPDLLAALLWVVLLFAALASLAHTFSREVEAGTLPLLRLVASPTAIALGKLLFNLLFLALLELITVPVFLVLMGAPPVRWGPFLLILGLGGLALAATTTLVGAVVAQARARGTLFAAACLPLLIVVLAAGVAGLRAQWEGASVAGEARLLAAYAAVVLGVSLLLFDHVWED